MFSKDKKRPKYIKQGYELIYLVVIVNPWAVKISTSKQLITNINIY